MKLQDLVTWHKWLGVFATIFIIILSITGVMLIHTVDLNLQEKFVDSGWLLRWYEISPKNLPRSYAIDDRIFTQIDERLYLDNLELVGNDEVLLGAIKVDNEFVIAFENSLFLLTPEGELIERLTSLQGLPQGLLYMGLSLDDRIVIKTSRDLYMADLDLLEWRATVEENITWSVSTELPAALLSELLGKFRGKGLSVERVIIDIHSGRFLGKYGIWIIDVVAIFFLVLSTSGWCVWFKRRALQNEIDADE